MEQDDLDLSTRARRAKDKRDEQKQEVRAEALDMVELMELRSGRNIVHRLLSQAGVFRTTFAVDPYQTAFNEGQRNLGLMLIADVMRYTPEQYALMLKENADVR